MTWLKRLFHKHQWYVYKDGPYKPPVSQGFKARGFLDDIIYFMAYGGYYQHQRCRYKGCNKRRQVPVFGERP